jgi:hypothetical protein
VTFTGNLVPTYPNSFAALPTGVTLPRPTIFVFDPDYENPEIHQASLGGEYALSPDLSIGASYLFVAGRRLQRSRDLNVGVPVATAVPVQGGGSVGVQQFPTARPFSNFDRIIRFESTAESTYNGLTLELKKRFTGGLQASLAYTLGKVEDTVPDATAVVPNSGDDAKFASNPADFEADRAPGNNDQRHRLVLSGYWDLGYWREAQGAAKALLDGWSLSWIASVESGQPYSQVIVNDVNRDGNTRNDIVPGARNSETTPTRYNIDLRVARRVPLTGRVKLELIAEAFNLLNSTNITSQRNGFYTFTSGVLVPQSNFGQDLGAADARIVQLAAKLTF